MRVKDIDFHYKQLFVRDAKGQKDRVTTLPETLIELLRPHLTRVAELHRQDLKQGYGSVYLPYALARKYPNADREWHGNSFSLQPTARAILERRPYAGITCMNRRYRKP